LAHRIEKINELIKDELSSAIRFSLKDPRLENKIVGISRTKTTPDMKYCQVYVSIYADRDEAERIMEVLEGAKGFLRKKVAEALTTRYSPQLIFIYDDSYENYEHIEKLLREIKNDEKN
jgi:ribosome-binding factor A